MKDNGQILVSASVLKEAFRKKQNCEISPLVLYFIQKKIREHKENNMQPYADVKINSMSNGKGFHEESYSILRNGFANSGKKDAIAFRLLKMRKRSREVLIEPTIFSEKSRMIGEPDMIFLSKNSADILELKYKNLSGRSALDAVQVEAYMMIFESQDSKIIKKGCSGPKPIKKDYKKKVRGSVLYRDGKIAPVLFQHEDSIELNVLEVLDKLEIYQSISDLPGHSRCNPKCVNINYCTERTVNLYEDTPASSGGIEIESPLYSQRA